MPWAVSVPLPKKLSCRGRTMSWPSRAISPRWSKQSSASLSPARAAEVHRTTSAYAEQTGQGHGRVETRCAWISDELEAELTAAAWPGLRSIGMVEATRTLAGETTVEQRFYLTSLPPDASRFARAVRNHWGIENQLHWTLDVTFGEDQSRLRTGHGPENVAVLRHIALNLLHQEPSTKSMPRKRLACALNSNYLLKVLLGE